MEPNQDSHSSPARAASDAAVYHRPSTARNYGRWPALDGTTIAKVQTGRDLGRPHVIETG
jgi:hypothetical protein